MIDRRGMARAHSHWRPRPREVQRPPFSWPAPGRRRLRALSVRMWAIAGLFVVVLALACVGVLFRSVGGSTTRVLPATPRAWLDAYDAAAVDSPARVCSQLFSAELAGVYARAAHGSCERYFSNVYSRSLKILGVSRAGATAVLDLRETAGHVEWAVVLDRGSSGWRAVALFGGHLLR